jgi:3-methyladenine DNA glycosylase AlkD
MAPRVVSKKLTSVPDVLALLERKGSKANREGMARYAIVAPKVFGVSVAEIRKIAKGIGRNHEFAQALWDTGWYEARMLACFVADPQEMTSAEMDRWARDFDNWAITDTACFHLFDRSPHAWRKVDQWSRRKGEFVRRAGLALLASLALHDKKGSDDNYRERLGLIEELASDDRNFVKKAVSWALHGIGCRSAELHEAALALGRKLTASKDPTERWVGRDAVRKLDSAATWKRLMRATRSSS